MTNTKLLLEYADIATLLCNIAILLLMVRRSILIKYSTVAAYLFAVVISESVTIPMMFFRKYVGVSRDHAYFTMMYSNLFSFVVTTILIIAIIYSVFNAAMSPFKGLQRIGAIVFRWVTGVSALLAAVIAFGPHIFSTGTASTAEFTAVLERVQEGVNVLTLCLLLFVCLSIRPLGLTYRSRIFGVSLGLGIISTAQLIEAAWFPTTGAHSVYSPIYLVSTTAYLAAFAVWGMYFAMPEPERKMILLPTTSPFFHWNRISEALGDAPGNVAVGFNASMISPIETMVMTAMSRGTRERATLARVRAQSEMDSIVAS